MRKTTSRTTTRRPSGPRAKGGEVGSIRQLRNSFKGGGSSSAANIPENGVAVRFITEPDKWHKYWRHWADSTYYACVDGECQFCLEGDKPQVRFLANAVDLDAKQVRAFALPYSLAEILYARYDKYGTIQDREYELTRRGSGKNDTVYDAMAEAPTAFRGAHKYKPLDLAAIVNAMIPGADDDDEEDEEDEPTSRRSSRTGGTDRSRGRRDADDDDDDERQASRRRRRTVIDDDDDDDERPARRRTGGTKSITRTRSTSDREQRITRRSNRR